ncbi:MAG: hypothetical protein QCH35_03290 [Methanomicrobiaceae archaeon]|nr:hypothetical protein [Methanomicrobiaceae archaeon]
MPEITDDELGRRMFQIRKERHVEETIDKIRHSLGDEWTAIPHEEKKVLQDLLGDAWIAIGRQEWGRYAFSRLTKADLDRLIGIGYAREQKNIQESAAIEEVKAVLSHTLQP